MKDLLSANSQQGDHHDIEFSRTAQWVRFGKYYWNLKTRKVNKIEGCIDKLSFSADETRMISGCDDGSIKFWDLKTGGEILKITADPSRIETVLLMADNKHMLTIGKEARLWKLGF